MEDARLHLLATHRIENVFFRMSSDERRELLHIGDAALTVLLALLTLEGVIEVVFEGVLGIRVGAVVGKLGIRGLTFMSFMTLSLRARVLMDLEWRHCIII